MSSSVPAAVVGFHNALVAGVPSPTLIHFGEPRQNTDAPEHVSVAYAGEGGGDVIDTTSDWASLGAQRHEERFEVTNALVVWAGDDSEAALQTAFLRAYVVFAAIAAAVDNDITLAGSVRESRIGSHSTAVEQTSRGVSVTLTFRLVCAVRVTY